MTLASVCLFGIGFRITVFDRSQYGFIHSIFEITIGAMDDGMTNIPWINKIMGYFYFSVRLVLETTAARAIGITGKDLHIHLGRYYWCKSITMKRKAVE